MDAPGEALNREHPRRRPNREGKRSATHRRTDNVGLQRPRRTRGESRDRPQLTHEAISSSIRTHKARAFRNKGTG